MKTGIFALVFAGLLALSFNEVPSPAPGKYIGKEYYYSLRLKENGKFRFTYHTIRIQSFRGHWFLSGDTLRLDFKNDSLQDRIFLRDAKGNLNSLDSSCSFSPRIFK